MKTALFNTDGVAASRLQLIPGPWPTVLDALCARFPAIDRDAWLRRFQRGLVLDADGTPLMAAATHRAGTVVQYFREVVDEPRIPFQEAIVHLDEHILVADKPHFLPVTPAGRFVTETLLARLMRRTGIMDLVPLHRIDRATAGLVLLSTNPGTRGTYQALFRERRISKHYQALAPPLPDTAFPLLRRSCLATGDPFFRMAEIEGEPNSESRIEVIEQSATSWCYALEPVTGKKHQLRVHMAALGAPIANDGLYPVLRDCAADDYSRPLKLLARSLAFVDPLTGRQRSFQSQRTLSEAGAPISAA
ncbi:RluA family pseudouridine synthase [Lysobacter sp. A421]